MCVLPHRLQGERERGGDAEEEGERQREHGHRTHAFFFSPQASCYLCRQSRPPLIKTNVRRGSADNDRSAWISAHKEKTAGHGIDGTRIASRTRHPVPRCLPPTSTGADEETVASYHRVSLPHSPMQPRTQAAGCLSLLVSKANQQLPAPLCAKPVITRRVDNFGAVLFGLRISSGPVSGIYRRSEV